MKKYLFFAIIFLAVLGSCETEEPIPTYTLSTTISPSEGGKIIVSPQSPNYKEGDVVTLTPEPNEHWVFKQWEGDGSGSSTPLQITMNTNKSVVGLFVKRDYPLTLTITGEGTVEEKIVPNPGGREYPHGTTVELTPKPKEGWVFETWGGDLTGTETPKNITVDKEKKVTVKFKEIPKFFLHQNGVTCLCPDTKPGDKGIVNGVEFESVDNELLRKRRNEGVDLTKVCTSLVTELQGFFKQTSFNQPIGNWDVSNVSIMELMFNKSQFNQPIGNWDVSNVTNMNQMFSESQFNQPIGNWDVRKVQKMYAMFQNSKFNQPIGNWNVGNVNAMEEMFNSSLFNQPIGNWNVSNVKRMEGMFENTPFNQPIGNWNVSNVERMDRMFRKTPFNQPIGNWNVSKVRFMSSMFEDSMFNQNISKWCVTNVTAFDFFSTRSPLTTENAPKWGTCPN
jgi:uncharacterized repeat protein (TIGR02543 family)